MHGQNRAEYKARLRDESTAKKLAQKAQQWNVLSAELLKRRRDAKQVVTAACASTTTQTSGGDDSSPSSTDGEDREHHDSVKSSDSTADSGIANTLETLALTERLLSVNPDPAYLWNHRMELLLSLTKLPQDSPTLTPIAFFEQEREMTTTCLKRNPKAYGAWFHRKWSIRRYLQLLPEPDPDSCQKLMHLELQQCAQFLNLDERNFHCWSYRRFVVAALASSVLLVDHGGHLDDLDGSWISWCHRTDGTPGTDEEHSRGSLIGAQVMGTRQQKPLATDRATAKDTARSDEIRHILQEEWNFTTQKIRQNFSNGSAFHHRSKLVPLLYPDASFIEQADMVRAELEIIGNAIYTEPDDQTPWWYLRFIIEWADPNSAERSARRKAHGDASMMESIQKETDVYVSMLKEQFENIHELVEAEDGLCKWGLLGMNMIATILYKRLGEGDREGYNWKEESYGCLKALEALDPDRVVRYRNMIKRYDCMVR